MAKFVADVLWATMSHALFRSKKTLPVDSCKDCLYVAKINDHMELTKIGHPTKSCVAQKNVTT